MQSKKSKGQLKMLVEFNNSNYLSFLFYFVDKNLKIFNLFQIDKKKLRSQKHGKPKQ